MARARGYIVARQGADGLWAAGAPGEGGCDWLTGLLGRCGWALLADEEPDDGLLAAVDGATVALAGRQRGDGGWGYDDRSPTDAESTAWALICLLSQQRSRPYATAQARRFLERHRDAASGGFRLRAATGAGKKGGPGEDLEPGRDPELEPELTPAVGEPLACVTAAVVLALTTSARSTRAAGRASEFIRAAQGADGLWRSALWSGPGVPTVLALAALMGSAALDGPVRAAAATGVGALLDDPDVLASSAGVAAAPHVGLGGRVDVVADRIVQAQDADGGWTPARPVRTPVAQALEAGGADAPGAVREGGRLLTTALAVTALHLAG